MLRTSLVLLCWFLAASVAWAPTCRAEEPIRVLLTFGGHGFEEEPFYAMFDALPGVVYETAVLPDDAELLKPGLEEKFDVIVRYDMVPGISPEQREAFRALLERGIGLVALHHNLAAHPRWPEYRKIIGGAYLVAETEIDGVRHEPSTYSHGEVLSVHVAEPEHPITRGLEDFTIHDETYHGYYTSPRVKVLMTTDSPKNDPEVAWVTRYAKSRVFYLMLGHDSESWKHPAYPKTLLQGIRWASGRTGQSEP